MRAIQADAIVEITKLVITFLITQLIKIDRQNYVGCVSDSVTHQNTALIQGNRISRCVTATPNTPYKLFEGFDRSFHCRGDFLQLLGGMGFHIHAD